MARFEKIVGRVLEMHGTCENQGSRLTEILRSSDSEGSDEEKTAKKRGCPAKSTTG